MKIREDLHPVNHGPCINRLMFPTKSSIWLFFLILNRVLELIEFIYVIKLLKSLTSNNFL